MPRRDSNPTGLTAAEHAVLSMLHTLGEATGWQVLKASNGALKRGSVYTLLARMRARRIVTSRVETGPRTKSDGDYAYRRVYYRVAPAGETALAAWAAAADVWKK